ncbi:hypothetical protein TCAL_00516 [Tigriopus californicus]|uniref:Peptidase M3A/M3B catalytic domain-containing protein n=1 Tax=Tigriopus californicus TaxID=6832 RepID=A0A553PB42_TIGCA|nr:mitochondrial intermediate peptidase-like [Tigriopus californicus]TRY74904.1 hypothetical protein TCAL_00516 [Tigriopus californicus]
MSSRVWLSSARGVSCLGRRAYRASGGLSPLGTAFNALKFPQILPQSAQTGLFQIPSLVRAEGFRELQEACLTRSAQLVDEACRPERGRLLARILDDLSDELCRVADLAEFVRLAHPDEAFASEAEAACIAVSGLVEQLNTHVGLYGALSEVVRDGDRFPESHVDQHVAKLFLLDFQQCGIHLDDDSRNMVVKLNDHILQLGQQFAAQAHRPRAVKKSVLPENMRHLFSLDGDNVVLNGLHFDNPNSLAREAAYKIYYGHDRHQEALLSDLLSQRHHLAVLCEYPTFAHRAMSESLGAHPENVATFLTHLSQGLRPRLDKDFGVLLAMKQAQNPMAKTLQVWDAPYYSVMAKRQWFDIDAQKISEYFSLGVCMEGLNEIFTRLFNVELVVEKPTPGEIWHNSVFKLAVVDLSTATVLGHIYCDFFSRQGKPHQDCHFTIRGGRLKNDGSYQNPVVVLMLNLPSPGWTSPTLMSSSNMDNLFHEMGHAMHSMLARTKYQHVTGTRCSTDFAEVPSTLMEYFSSDPRILARMSRHYKTGESLPLDMCERLCASKLVFGSIDIHTQLFYSSLDQVLHTRHPLKGSTTEILQQVHEDHHPLPYPEGTAWHHRFSHLVGYGARYYSYLMARSVASSIWQCHFQEDPLNGESGGRYRSECLSHGGGKPSHDLVSDFLGKEVLPEDLADALISELDAKTVVLNKATFRKP